MSIRSNIDRRYRKSRNKTTSRPKTFKTEEAAKKYASEKGIKSYTLVNLKSPESSVKKLRIVASK